jgi:hypothetical protein
VRDPPRRVASDVRGCWRYGFTVGIPAWAWFLIAVVLAAAGVAVLLRERGTRASDRHVETGRRRWAERRGWRYHSSDEELLGEWAAGAVAFFGGGRATDVAEGAAFTADGRRSVYVLDQEVDGAAASVIVALRVQAPFPARLEMWLPSVPFQRDHMPELLGPVGRRYGFVSSVEEARPLVTRALVDVVDAIGEDVTVVWLEGAWVLAAAEPGASTARLEELIQHLGELADVLDPFDAERPVRSE